MGSWRVEGMRADPQRDVRRRPSIARRLLRANGPPRPAPGEVFVVVQMQLASSFHFILCVRFQSKPLAHKLRHFNAHSLVKCDVTTAELWFSRAVLFRRCAVDFIVCRRRFRRGSLRLIS